MPAARDRFFRGTLETLAQCLDPALETPVRGYGDGTPERGSPRALTTPCTTNTVSDLMP